MKRSLGFKKTLRNFKFGLTALLLGGTVELHLASGGPRLNLTGDERRRH